MALSQLASAILALLPERADHIKREVNRRRVVRVDSFAIAAALKELEAAKLVTFDEHNGEWRSC